MRLRFAYFVTCKSVVKDKETGEVIEVRCLYDPKTMGSSALDGRKETDFKTHLNPNSLEILTDSRVEPSLAAAELGARRQFERLGYFCIDSEDSTQDRLVFNRTVTLRDTWAKISKGKKK